MQQSADVVDTSGASSGADADSNSFKTLWKKAINKLKLRRTSSADDSKLSSTSPKADEEVGEVDPVYSFLKLTSGTREGASIIPGEDHYCCSKTDQDIGVEAADASGDPSSCQCPCHLPERLQSAHSAWMQSFASKKT